METTNNKTELSIPEIYELLQTKAAVKLDATVYPDYVTLSAFNHTGFNLRLNIPLDSSTPFFTHHGHRINLNDLPPGFSLFTERLFWLTTVAMESVSALMSFRMLTAHNNVICRADVPARVQTELHIACITVMSEAEGFDPFGRD